MKRIFELEEAELVVLTDEQVAKYIDYECAIEGAPMLPPAPGPEPTKLTKEPDATVYHIGGVVVTDAEHAGRILSAITSGTVYSENYPSGDYGTRYLQPIAYGSYNFPKIETGKAHSCEQWDSIKEEHSQYADRKQRWEAINSSYHKAVTARQKINDKVWEVVSDARTHSYERDRLREEFKRYMELAEGNNRVALNFLKKAKDISEFPELDIEFCPEQKTIEQSTPGT